MSKSLYITSLEPQSGKAIVALGFMEQLTGHLKSVGVFRPIGREECGADRVISLLKSLYHGEFPEGGGCGVPLEEAYRAIDYRTLVLLFGMMVLVANLRLALFFRVLAQAVVRRVTNPAWLLVAVVFVSGALAALFVNDTICLVCSGRSRT